MTRDTIKLLNELNDYSKRHSTEDVRKYILATCSDDEIELLKDVNEVNDLALFTPVRIALSML